VVSLDSDAVRGNATDRVSVLEVNEMELDGGSRIPPGRSLDPRRIGRHLQRHRRLRTRLFVDAQSLLHGRRVRLGARPDQRALSTPERCSFACL
jgi:hypothetical protein